MRATIFPPHPDRRRRAEDPFGSRPGMVELGQEDPHSGRDGCR
jgi:hypothetical protein